MRPEDAVIYCHLEDLAVVALDLKAAEFEIRFFALDQVLDTIEMRHAGLFQQAFVQLERRDLLLSGLGDIDINGALRIDAAGGVRIEEVPDFVWCML